MNGRLLNILYVAGSLRLGVTSFGKGHAREFLV